MDPWNVIKMYVCIELGLEELYQILLTKLKINLPPQSLWGKLASLL
jgi:hypothetical protein